MPGGGLRGAADEGEVFVDDGGVYGIAELAEAAFRTMEELHGIEHFRFVQLRLMEDQIADGLMPQVEAGERFGSTDLARHRAGGKIFRQAAEEAAAAVRESVGVQHEGKQIGAERFRRCGRFHNQRRPG